MTVVERTTHDCSCFL